MSPVVYSVLQRVLFALDAERAHRMAISAARVAEWLIARGGLGARPPAGSPRLEQRILGLAFPNPVGLAAGFDKDGVAPHLWPLLGFGFAEIGTVTARPQPGNPTPRLFRLSEDRAVINRLGFNSSGASAVAGRLRRSLALRPAVPIGINVGCSRAAMGDELAEREDYRLSVRSLAPLAGYLAINVSSPNTPGLRELQAPQRLRRLVEALRGELGAASGRIPPLLVKIAPDLADEALPEICGAALGAGAAGFIAGNTTLSRAGLRNPLAAQAGGLSGAPLRERATELVARVREAAGPGVPIIGVGGVTALADVLEKLEAGADLVALYTGLVFEGPLLAARLVRELDAELARRGLQSVAELGGRLPRREGDAGAGSSPGRTPGEPPVRATAPSRAVLGGEGRDPKA